MSNNGDNKIIVVRNIGNTLAMVPNEKIVDANIAWNTRMGGSKRSVERKFSTSRLE
jgi:small-conductance mechanosensitive channel